MTSVSVGTHLPRIVVTRDQRRRRMLLIGIAVLIALSIMPVLGHHMTHGASTLLAGRHHLGVFCLIALHQLLGPVHTAAHGLLALGLALAIFHRVRAHIRANKAIGPLTTCAVHPSSTLTAAAVAAGLDPHRVHVVHGLPNPAFTVGWFRPRVYVSASLEDWLSREELTAVLAHERVHVTRRDPLRLSILRFFADLLFWLPALRWLAHDVHDEAEIRADDIAAGEHPLALASAILAIAQWRGTVSETLPVDAVGFAHQDILERRVRRLAGEDPPRGTRVTWWSIASATIALAVVWSAGVVVTHPMPTDPPPNGTQSVTDPCLRRSGAAIFHLVCPGRHHSDQCIH